LTKYAEKPAPLSRIKATKQEEGGQTKRGAYTVEAKDSVRGRVREESGVVTSAAEGAIRTMTAANRAPNLASATMLPGFPFFNVGLRGRPSPQRSDPIPQAEPQSTKYLYKLSKVVTLRNKGGKKIKIKKSVFLPFFKPFTTDLGSIPPTEAADNGEPGSVAAELQQRACQM
jgi:hypothetical protein